MDDVTWRVTYQASCPELRLGAHRFDTRHRAVIMGVVQPAADTSLEIVLETAAGLVAAGADAIELVLGGAGRDGADDRLLRAVEGLRARVDVPVAVDADEVDLLGATLDAGVALVVAGPGPAAALLTDVAAAGASVLLGARRREVGGAAGRTGGRTAMLRQQASEAAEAGIPQQHVVLDLDLRELCDEPELVASGAPLVLSTSDTAVQALGIALGSRVIRTHEVRPARRTAAVMAALLAARADAAEVR
ncbi:MAG: dihydropteroate synthase [Acidimicrobiales bacterium]